MSRYVVHFMKDVLGENGNECEICQSVLEIDAASEGQATELAKQRFCQLESLCDWSLHADRIKVRAADAAARLPVKPSALQISPKSTRRGADDFPR